MARRTVSERRRATWGHMDCVVIVPMLGRAGQVERVAASLAASTDRARILFVCTSGDADVLAAVAAYDHIVLAPRERGDYAHKINVGVAATDEPLIFTGAIDIHFHPGWLDLAQALMSDIVQVVGTNDLSNDRTAKGGHSTHSLIAREYCGRGLIDGRTGLLCEDYLHEFVDDELIGTANRRGAYAHCPVSWVEHLHPIAGKAEWDATYRAMNDRMAADRDLFDRRRPLWT